MPDAFFTCLSCSIGFSTADDQRVHYRSDHHRYNMKRRVAGFPPVNASMFNEKIKDNLKESLVSTSPKDYSCSACRKIYTTENAYKTHLLSKKHRENMSKPVPKSSVTIPSISNVQVDTSAESKSPSEDLTRDDLRTPGGNLTRNFGPSLSDDTADDDLERDIDQKIGSATTRLSSTDCLFCTQTSSSLRSSLTHMSNVHSFFIPDIEYLVDLAGLINYLGEKIAIGNICMYCNGKGRQFHTLAAVRQHMVDKSHCKIAYDTEDDRLEISDYYDFTRSYPDSPPKRDGITGEIITREEDDEWEDVDDGDTSEDEILDDPYNRVTYGDSEYELVLPSGSRIGHRSMRRYYVQSLHRTWQSSGPRANSNAALVRRLLTDGMIPRRTGYGAHGIEMSVVRARNPGEAREAGRHIREYRDQKRREDYKTRVGFNHNHQKHYRDPCE
ncbi:hypothetical protein AMATHDRAFT_141083 [Amanita thiersii Skay4041]|uniref:C2H2-type domain-containing protein n=1 Tax=Amanita thiersii Skay4041 TaxID=703135 RepID=A0A2A9NRL7_9AGAR|nr:hypothetical protein AMATHDRAFT_141083 [Amanita thiersii Skay4041]